MNGQTVTVCLAGPDGHRRQELEGLPQSGNGVFGPEQARLAAEDWVDELELVDTLPGRPGAIGARCLGPTSKKAECQRGPSNATRCVNLYQSIADTFVQLFRPDGSGLIGSRDGIRTNRGFAKEPSMNELDKFCPPQDSQQ